MTYPATASQTVGPYFKIGLQYLDSNSLCSEAAAGVHIRVSGQVFDGDGVGVPDAQLELWQADDQGRFAGYDPSGRGDVSDGFGGFARVPVNEHGAFHFSTVYPGSVASPDGGQQAPHVVVMLSMRGLLKHLYTRIYFSGEALNEQDEILQAVPADRRATLFAREEPEGSKHYRFDIHLQGENETVFFQY
jgi:protocatechuate 3,4-dioxygenase alpha subunit